ncbi:MAG: DNA polymerase I [Cyanobacteriota bacterium]|nr:DNA polymerase I [Cyanobacteriota bacterium]MDY6363490.1 DNA polymerase I [Cyanobacteriota bacterium]
MGKSKTLILIDGHALAFREFYALERTQMRTNAGTPTWAVYGFFKAIFDLLKNKDINADSIGVAFDVSHHTFRTEKYVEYKANREAMPDDMQAQMNFIYEGLNAFNIPIYTKAGFEADDVIGTISQKACDLGHKTLILTGDQDSFQLIDKKGCVKVIIPTKGELKEYGWDEVYAKLGVYPDQVIDYKALRGDTSDNIPGIKGIGEKTAVKLLAQFQTVDNVLAHADEISGNAVREKIKNGVESAKLSKYLATIVRDVDIDFDFDKTKIELPEISKVTDFFRQMQFYSFLKNIENILKTFNKDGKYALMQETAQNPQSPNGQLGLFAQAVQTQVNKSEMNYESKLITDSQDLADLVKKLKSSSLITYKTYSQYENATNFDLTGVAVAINKDYSYDSSIKITDTNAKNECYYIPVGHNIENQLPEKDVFEQLKDVLQNPEIKKFTHDVKNELNIANRYGVQLQGVVFDTMLASYIKDSAASNAFDIQCMERINHILNSVITDNKKVKFTDYDVENIKTYTGDCSSGLFELTKFWINNLDKQEYKILTDIEIPLSYVLSGMELNGVSVDTDYLKQLTKELDAQISQLEQRIYELAGSTFNINSPKQVGEILFDKLNIQTGKKRGKNKKSTSAQVLNELAQDHEIVQRILDYRKYAKLKSTYTESLPELIDPRDNRIHTTYNQALTTTGRLSSSNPNLQNIPVRTPEGNKIRQAFIPKDRENSVILSADYSQIELRLLAHVSEDEHLIEAFKSGVDVHTLTASKVFGVPVDEVTKDMRRRSKAVNFGIVYGQSKYGLAKALQITNDEAESFINKYFETYPKVKLYMQAMVELVEKQGYVETIFGRKRYLDKEINSPNGMIREFAKRAAINHPMQGSASDLIKIAMIDFYKKLKDNNLKSELIIQVHDELVVEVKKSELDTVTELVKQAMELNQPLRVPLLVDINTGASWKES